MNIDRRGRRRTDRHPTTLRLNYSFLMAIFLAALVSASVYAFVVVVVEDVVRGMR